LLLLKSKRFNKTADEAKLSLTLRKCLSANNPSGVQFAMDPQTTTADDNDDEEDDDEVRIP